MKITGEMMDKQLRSRGRLLGRMMSGLGENGLRRRSRIHAKIQSLRPARAPRGVQVAEERIARPDGSPLRVLVHAPLETQSAVPGLLWIHGGGYALGQPEMDQPIYTELIRLSDCIVVAPEYRLSLEAPYPAALEDCYTALLWLRDNADRLGVRDDQIAVGGPSAGGGLTAALTMYARDKGEVAVAFQMPIYPMIDDRSVTENDAPVWDGTTNRSAWKLYLGERYGTDEVPSYAAPARATDYTGLPPTLTYVGDLDTFQDETTRYVENLRAAGIPVEFRIFPGCWHGFDLVVPKAEVSLKAAQFRARWFRRAIHDFFAPQPTRSPSRRRR